MKLPPLPETALTLNVVMSGLAAVPSPQLIVPEKLLAGAGCVGVREGGAQAGRVPARDTALVLAVPAVRRASATVVEPVSVVELPPTSLMTKVMG